MNTKTTLILGVIAVLAVGYVFYAERQRAERPDEPEQVAAGRDLFDPKPDDVDRVELQSRYAGNMVFTRTDGTWSITEPVEAPALEYQVTSVINRLRDAQYARAFEEGDRDRPSGEITGLSDPVARVALYSGNVRKAELRVGSRLPTGRGNYVSLGEDDPTIYESREDLTDAFSRRLREYRDRRVVKADLADVRRVQVEGTTGFVVVRSNDRWVLEAPTRGRASKDRVERVARKFCNLYVQNWIEDEPDSYRVFRLDEPRLKVTMRTEKELPAPPADPEADEEEAQPEPEVETRTHVLLVGGPTDAEGRSYFARLESAPWVFTVSESDVKELAPGLTELRDQTIADVVVDRVEEVEVQAAGESMALRKQEGNWVFADGTVADFTAVSDLIRSVKDLKASSFADPDDPFLEIDWDEPRGRVSLRQEGELQPATVLVGPPTPSGRMVYVRNAAEDAVAVVHEDEVAALLHPPVSYHDRMVLDFMRERARRVEISRRDAPDVVLARHDNQWRIVEPIDAPTDPDASRNLMMNLASLRAVRVVSMGDREAYGLDDPDVRLAVHLEPLTTQDGVEVVGESAGDASAVDEAALREEIEEQVKAATRPAEGGETRPAITLEELLEFQRSLPKEASEPGEIVENPLMTELLEQMIAEQRAQEAAEADPAREPSPPSQTATIHRLAIARHDGRVFAALDGREAVYELEDKVYEDAVAELHDRRLAQFSVGDVVEIAFTVDQETVALRKSADDWRSRQDPFLPIDDQKVTESINDIRDLKTHRYVDYAAADLGAYGLNGDVDRVEVALTDGRRIAIHLAPTGPEGDPDASRYAALAESDKVFLLTGEQAEKFTRRLDDFARPGPGA